ncbi:PRK06851 family protein [Paenibacillus sp. YSY-4.3]
MAGRERHYFARGNTAEGLVSLVDSIYYKLDAVYVLEGDSQEIGTILARLANGWGRRDWNLHLIHQPLQSDLLEGIIIEDARIGLIADQAWPKEGSPEGIEVRRFDFGSDPSGERLADHREHIAALEHNIAEDYTKAYETFQRTLRIHDDWEKIYIDTLDRAFMNQLAVDWADQYLVAVEGDGYGQAAGEGVDTGAGAGAGLGADAGSQEPGTVTRRFLGAATWRGAVDFVLNLTEDVPTRIFVKGRPGSGKSTLFKKIAATAAERGIDTEVYHCGFDPNSLDMLVFRSLGVAIFDSTAPHEHFPLRDGDSILDIYELAIAPYTDEKHAEEIAEVRSRYTTSMQIAISYLAEVKQNQDRLSAIYRSAADEEAISRQERLLAEDIEARVGN